jgi:hypothetical protein
VFGRLRGPELEGERAGVGLEDEAVGLGVVEGRRGLLREAHGDAAGAPVGFGRVEAALGAGGGDLLL